MEVLTRMELRLRQAEFLAKIQKGAVFIHPTDTIYGLGCNALDIKAVEKIRQLKNRTATPFSIWVPSTEWVKEHCVIDEKAQGWLRQLPGSYTLIVKLKDKNAVAPSVTKGLETIGIRLPKHWFGKIIEEAGFPIVTTSANRSGQLFMTSLEDLDPEIEKGVDFLIYEGPKEGRPSKIVNLLEGTMKER